MQRKGGEQHYHNPQSKGKATIRIYPNSTNLFLFQSQVCTVPKEFHRLEAWRNPPSLNDLIMHIMVVMTATTSKRGQIKPALHLNFVSLQSLSQSLDTKMESKKC